MVKSSELTWIVVSDLKKARKFFSQVLKLKEENCAEEFGWAEFVGEDGGTMIGLAAADKEKQLKPGQNAVITFSVDNLEATRKDFQKKGVKLIGDVMEVPGHVKLQTFCDEDGNVFQIVEQLGEKAH